MQEMFEYLKQYREELPIWLKEYKPGNNISFQELVNGRVGYYPGSGFDGNLVAVANKSHSVHSFLYVDYQVDKESLIRCLQDNGFKGYHSIDRIGWCEEDIMPNGQYSFPMKYIRNLNPMCMADKNVKPFCFTEILERDDEMGDDHGAERFAITFLFADGIATYYQLFVKQYHASPWLFLLQDHGFGGNYSRFGKGGLLDAIIKDSDILSEFVICGGGTRIWDGYTKVDGVNETHGGMHNFPRILYAKAK